MLESLSRAIDFSRGSQSASRVLLIIVVARTGSLQGPREAASDLKLPKFGEATLDRPSNTQSTYGSVRDGPDSTSSSRPVAERG